MTPRELELAHAEAHGWNRAIEAAAVLLEHRAFYYVGTCPTKLVPSTTGDPATLICAAAVRTLDKSVQAIDDRE